MFSNNMERIETAEEHLNHAVKVLSPLLSTHLESLKHSLKDIISSNRVLSEIREFDDLVRVLIKRDIIDPSSWTWKYVLGAFCKKHLGKTLEVVLSSYSSEPQSGTVADKNFRLQSLQVNSVRCEVPQLPPRVVEYLVDQIGSNSWRHLARALNVKEIDIEKLEKSYPQNAALCLRQVLELFISRIPNPNNTNVNSVLLKGLRNICRHDLVDGVLSILGL